MRFLRVFDSLKIVRAIFVAVACAFFIFPAKSDDCVVTKIFQGEQYTEENRLEKTLMSSSGTMSTNTNYYVTDYIPLKAGDYRFTIKDNGTGNRPVNIILYDKNNVIVSNPVSATTNTSLQTFNFNVPTDCFARISARNTTTNKTLQPVNPITYTEPCIKIATTKYNETKFAPVETDLNAARTTINNLITQMQTNAVNVSKLAVEKQTRPNADCPTGKNCLLVMDPTGAENWYEIAGADAVQSSSNVPDYFSFTTTELNAGDSMSFSLTPSGTFTVDWGDGTTPQVIERTNTTSGTYSHSYSNAGPKTIKITGRATGYSTAEMTSVLSVDQIAPYVISIDGSLGAIFPTLGNGAGQQPQFYYTFADTPITSIPAGLFSGITGAAAPYMFSGTFVNTQITSIPSGLFSGITGSAIYMFENTFADTPITSIPAGLFSGITGAAPYMFYFTFYNTQITSIPENLFRGVTGAAEGMFSNTFQNAPITSIPENLFSGVTGAARNMFSSTFYDTQITSIPENLFRGVTGAAPYMFYYTFNHTQITSIPENLFRGVTGAAESMFQGTFEDCYNIQNLYVPESTFAGLIQNNSPDATNFMRIIFRSTGLATTCPQNMTEVSTPYKSAYWSTINGNYAVMCRPNN